VFHAIKDAAGVIYRAAIWMSLDESGLLNAKMSNGPRNDGLIVRITMRVAVFLNKPTRSFDTPHATGCVSKVDCGNSIISLHRTNKRSTRLSLYGRGVRAIACYDRNRSTKLKQILQVHPCETARRFRVSRISFESTLGSAAASTL